MEIVFKQQVEGIWRRKDGISSRHITKSEMDSEILDLVTSGWKVFIHESKVWKGKIFSIRLVKL